MIFVLSMLFTFVYDRKNENHWSLLIIRYSLLITHYSEYKHPTNSHHFDQSIKAEFHYCVFYVPVLTERFKSFYKGVITWRVLAQA